MQDLERQQINDWLSDWLVEAEAGPELDKRARERVKKDAKSYRRCVLCRPPALRERSRHKMSKTSRAKTMPRVENVVF